MTLALQAHDLIDSFPHLAKRLDKRKSEKLYRHRLARTGPQEAELDIAGARYLSFCSNDYLGLANHPEVVASFAQAAQRYGLGSGGSHMISGHCHAHQALEEELADFMGRDKALLFSNGYMANTGVINALMEPGGLVLQDSLNHASLLDGGWLCRAESQRYPHANLEALEAMLAQSQATHQLIVSDGVFSMDGVAADLAGLSSLAKRHKALLMIDDAHGVGSIGDRGRGLIDSYPDLSQEDVPVLVGTLGKAFGSSGAFVCGDENLIEYLVQFSRPYVYSTAMPPAIAEATRTALRIVQRDPWRRSKVQELVMKFRRGAQGLGLELTDSVSPIQAIILGSSERALAVSEGLRQRGLFVTAIRPPTVPVGTARLRVTFSASHTDEHLHKLLRVLEEVC
ncbi:MAG: 8-amino-7-oxononanoate synthase [Pseudohongiellaceae bacterium]|nr:8-amino-7-oxononanoate synthase [Pseudohongiellaceae bacterium]